jgi:hypothetical protein
MELPNVLVQLDQWKCKLFASRYVHDGNVSLQLIDMTEGCPIATATINPQVRLPDDEVMIKDYSENRGMIAALQGAGVIGETPLPRPQCEFPVFKLLVPLPAGFPV